MPCVPAEDRGGNPLDHPGLSRWLPADLALWGEEAATYLLNIRWFVTALQESGDLDWLAKGEAFRRVMVLGTVQGKAGADRRRDAAPGVEDLLDGIAADAARLVLVSAAAPERDMTWTDEGSKRASRLLDGLWDFTLARAGYFRAGSAAGEEESAGSSSHRARLARWTRAAVERTTEHYDRVEMHRVPTEIIRLLEGIGTFEERAGSGRSALDPEDQRAAAAALSVVLQLVAPIAPHLAAELWERVGHGEALEEKPWPRG